ncbi:hypothetical protein HN512_04850 [Candidatus Peregrinibacteria bacterium]|jgi:hypothetical protein|nr:hypothetical protein [Candidatus Peregrinibacteria bacterium]MBT3599134.1 hypothetical protein [Candidatus Peregrinibacteria bacterium]MBT4367451.1 hypothetical protein [Candidatus Peregrinibacteria bacterium]MBT4585966.1 hypothetical protein [Candidatus Peregrinibacteria bacterium]MBT6730774.1 hypothetical protein [Candidatus Peregrinibacteria bacterium]
MDIRFLKSLTFWKWFVVAAVLTSTLFMWELGFVSFLPSPPRPAPYRTEFIFTLILIIFISLNSGLIMWNKRNGICPVGTKRATGLAGAIGAIGLLCPVCFLFPLGIFGLSLSLSFLGPYIPILRIIALILLTVSTLLLWPKNVS